MDEITDIKHSIINVIRGIEERNIRHGTLPVYARFDDSRIYNSVSDKCDRQRLGQLITEMIAEDIIEIDCIAENLYIREPEIEMPSRL